MYCVELLEHIVRLYHRSGVFKARQGHAETLPDSMKYYIAVRKVRMLESSSK